jgi:hypothetical protein
MDISEDSSFIYIENYDGENNFGIGELAKVETFHIGDLKIDLLPNFIELVNKMINLVELCLYGRILDFESKIGILDLSKTTIQKLVIEEGFPLPIKLPIGAEIYLQRQHGNFYSKLYTSLCGHIIPHGFNVGNKKYLLGGYCRGGYWTQSLYSNDELVKSLNCIPKYIPDEEIMDFLSSN